MTCDMKGNGSDSRGKENGDLCRVIEEFVGKVEKDEAIEGDEHT